MSKRSEAIYNTAKHYAKLVNKPEQRYEFRRTISALWRADVYTYTEYQFILGYVYKSLDRIEKNAYKPYSVRRIYKEVL